MKQSRFYIDKDLGFKKINEVFSRFKSATASVGVLSGGQPYVKISKKEKKRLKDLGIEPDQTTLGEVAAAHELGTDTIPKRPFLSQAFEKHQRSLKKLSIELMRKIIDGTIDPESAVKKMGETHQGQVQENFIKGNFQPLSPLTLQLRKEQGISGTRPLIETGRLRQSITYKVKMKGNPISEK
jgi:hypothetical protein